jgi:hypothetical protein
MLKLFEELGSEIEATKEKIGIIDAEIEKLRSIK